MTACYFGRTSIASMLIDAGAHVNESDIHGENALMRASRKGFLDTVKLLVNAGADVNMKDSFHGN